jgi:hypothetical protein
MRQDATVPSPVLDYEMPQARLRPKRPWLAVMLLLIAWLGEAAVARNSRWPWPMTEDYIVFVMLLCGAVVLSIVTSLPGALIGIYGMLGLLAFWDGQFRHWNGPGQGYSFVIWRWACGWIGAFILTWAFCRATVLLRRPRPAP